MPSRYHYYRRIFSAYFAPGKSQLTFWHDKPAVNPRATIHKIGEYYMGFETKADYSAHSDSGDVPLLDYRGRIGLQYNPIAIAQWGLGNYNLYCRTEAPVRRRKFLRAADWLCRSLEHNRFGVHVWNHHFDWDYRESLPAPWYSGLAQGQGISLLLRAHRETGSAEYLHAAECAFKSFLLQVEEGGVTFTDEDGDVWFEEYLVSPPTHILNGFLWASWGVYDYYLATGDPRAQSLFHGSAQTLVKNLEKYDLGFWSLYEQSGTRLKMIASPFYHQLHIAQLRVMCRLTGVQLFSRMADRWENYGRNPGNRAKALCYKGAFKLCYY